MSPAMKSYAGSQRGKNNSVFSLVIMTQFSKGAQIKGNKYYERTKV